MSNNQYINLCLEGTYSIFNGLNKKDKEIITKNHTHALIRKGDFLYRKGEKPQGLICLASGKVKIFMEGVGGREQILKMVKQQGFIGYRAIFSDNPWPFSAVAIEDSDICIFEKRLLIEILKKNSDISLKLIKVITEELWFSNNRIVSLTQKHVRGRLAEALLVLRDTYGYEADGKTISISLPREDIANFSNMTTSNAIRVLSSLASERTIEIKGRKISILDNTTLEHISELG